MKSNHRVASRRERQNFESLVQQDKIKNSKINREQININVNHSNQITPNCQQSYSKNIKTPINNTNLNNSNLNHNLNYDNPKPNPQIQKVSKQKNFKNSKRDFMWEEKRHRKRISINSEIVKLGNRNIEHIPDRFQNTRQNYTPISNISNSNNYDKNMIYIDQQQNYNQGNYIQHLNGSQSKTITPYINPKLQSVKTPSENNPIPNNQQNYVYIQNYPVTKPNSINKNLPLETSNNQISYNNYSVPKTYSQNNFQYNQHGNSQSHYNNSLNSYQGQIINNQVNVQTPSSSYQNINLNMKNKGQRPINNLSIQNNNPNSGSQSSAPFNYNFSTQKIQNQNPYQRSNSITPMSQQVYGNNSDKKLSTQTPMNNYDHQHPNIQQHISTPYSNYSNQQHNSGHYNYNNQIYNPPNENYQSFCNYQKPSSSLGNKPFSNISFKNENTNQSIQIHSNGFDRQNSTQSMYLGRENKKFIYH